VAHRQILEYPDPRLRQRSLPVAAFDDDLARLVEDLFDTLYATSGIGLSAPQTGTLRRVLVMDHSGDASAPEVYVNPALLQRSAIGIVEESCLSVPGISGNVVRATRVRVQAQDRTGAPFERDLEGMPAVCLQHEIDHLDGKLFIDRLMPWRRLMFRLGAGRRRPEMVQEGS
jgi:peptide deformylase